MIDESAKPNSEEENKNDDFDSSLPPELRKLMEQTKSRQEVHPENTDNKENAVDGSNNPTDDAEKSKEPTQTSLEKKPSDDDPTSNSKLFSKFDNII